MDLIVPKRFDIPDDPKRIGDLPKWMQRAAAVKGLQNMGWPVLAGIVKAGEDEFIRVSRFRYALSGWDCLTPDDLRAVFRAVTLIVMRDPIRYARFEGLTDGR